MAQLIVESDQFQPGRWTLRADHPSVLAAVPDAIVQVLDLGGEALTVAACHYDEQNEHAEDAYANERREIPHGPHVEVVALPRAPQPHVVWIDRQHLLVGSAPPALGSRLLGLYVGSNGSMTIAVSHPSVAAQLYHALREDLARDEAWQQLDFVSQARFVVRYDALSKHGEAPTNVLHVRAPQPMAMQVQDALGRLQQMVAGW
jgi:hypothetical protein